MIQRHRLPCRLCVCATFLIAVCGGTRARADAWGAAWGRLDAMIVTSSGADSVLWNQARPEDWLIHAEADLRHRHPLLSTQYAADSEQWAPGGDGQAGVANVQTGDLARVLSVRAGIAGDTGGPFIDLSPAQNVYSFAHDSPSSSSDAAGLGQHDNLFSLQYHGSDPAPLTTQVTILLQGSWNLAGDSGLDDFWWADWFGYGEIYEAATGNVLAKASEYHYLAGPGSASAGGAAYLQFSVPLAYNTPYALRFYLDLESHAEARPVPAPSALTLLGAGLAALGLRRRSPEHPQPKRG